MKKGQELSRELQVRFKGQSKDWADKEHYVLKTYIYHIAESTCTGLTRARNSDFVLHLRYLQGPSLEAALVFLQRKEFYLSQTESSEILSLLDSMKITIFWKKKSYHVMVVLSSCLRKISKNNFQCPNLSNLDLSSHPSLTAGISEWLLWSMCHG